MKASSLFWQVAVFLSTPSVLTTLLLYLYPALLGCSFPGPTSQHEEACIVNPNESFNVTRRTEVAPFRLLALGDPQLEGDTSLPDPNDPVFPSLQRLWAGEYADDGVLAPVVAARHFFSYDVPKIAYTVRKRIDLFGNDFYLAHIYRSLYWWTKPTHVSVLGDLLGSQWISDGEFEWRGWRFWNRVFRHGVKVDDYFAGTQEVLGQDPQWARRVINIAGNHDIGYAGDIDRRRMERFERLFGKANWDIKFTLPPKKKDPTLSGFADFGGPPELRLVMLNSMNLDTPALDQDIQMETYDFINKHILPTSRPVEDRKAAVVVLTHIPLYKEEGVCTDGPKLEFGPRGVKEQNHLSRYSSNAILQTILGMNADTNAPGRGRGRKGIILTGHDHEGCDVYHHIPHDAERNGTEWHAKPWPLAQSEARDESIPGVREVTLRSMMGSYGGHAGLLSGWFDEDKGEWQFELGMCMLGVQHIWWAVHILDLVTISLYVAAFAAAIWEELAERKQLAKLEEDLKRKTPKVRFAQGDGGKGSAVATGREQNGTALKRQARPAEE